MLKIARKYIHCLRISGKITSRFSIHYPFSNSEITEENMKRGAQCLVQTINLSKPKTCVKPEQIQKLVSADVTASTPASDGTSKRWIPRTVTVKVCTRRDMRRSCPPKVRKFFQHSIKVLLLL